ncbi:MAG TPA: hypothetical protein VF613_05735 [Longimicrobium sp.]|jgi:hypothetical protein
MRGRRVPVRVVQLEDGVTFCVEYPDARVGTSSGRCTSHSKVRIAEAVNFTVRVPAGVRFTARTLGGNVEARGLVRAHRGVRSVTHGVLPTRRRKSGHPFATGNPLRRSM